MKTVKIFCGLILLSLIAIMPVYAGWNLDDDANFSDANVAYKAKEYAQAATLYEALLEKYPKVATLHYNLGNTYYRLGAMGKAILAYERALVLEPRNSDVRHNLSYMRDLLEYRVEDKRNWYIRAGDTALRYIRAEEISLLALTSYMLFILACAYVVFYNRGVPWGWRRKVLLIVAVCMFALWGAKNVQTNVIRDAVVMSDEVEARYGPSRSDQVAFRLGEGLKVHVVDKREDWSRIILTNGESGWVRGVDIQEVKAS